MSDDPFDPDHGDWTDNVEGTQEDGTEVLSINGSELIPGGED